MNNILIVFERHIKDMSAHDGRLASYATEAEIVATCAIFNLELFVKKSSNKNFEWQRFSTNIDDCLHHKPFACLVNSALHYNLMLRSHRPCSC